MDKIIDRRTATWGRTTTAESHSQRATRLARSTSFPRQSFTDCQANVSHYIGYMPDGGALLCLECNVTEALRLEIRSQGRDAQLVAVSGHHHSLQRGLNRSHATLHLFVLLGLP